MNELSVFLISGLYSKDNLGQFAYHHLNALENYSFYREQWGLQGRGRGKVGGVHIMYLMSAQNKEAVLINTENLCLDLK